MKYSKLDIEAVEQAADIRDFFPDLKGSGASRYCTCPQCGKSGKQKGLIVTHKKERNRYVNIAKCFSCGYTINGAINAYMELNGQDFIHSVEELAGQYGVNLVPLEDKKSAYVKSAQGAIKKSFCEMQLFASGLDASDVIVKVPVKGTNDFTLEQAFRKGGADNMVSQINESDDEMLIFYYDLDGNPMMFTPKWKTGPKRRYVRVRWSNPDLHTKDDKPIKYQTPKGAPCLFYIPQMIRDMYRNGEHIETLVIQEGEKKAEKACKHGIPSLGIQGIYNIGNSESGLIKELQYIVQKCTVRNVVLMMDSDWDHLNKNLQSGDHIDRRPNQFAGAVIKFQKYVSTLHKCGCSIDLYFGHIRETEAGDKGIDDLLVNTLHLKEDLLRQDIEDTINSHNGIGQYVDIHKISTKTEMQIRDFWHLNSSKEFFEKYSDQIKDLITFRFGRINYIVEDGKFKEAVRNAADTNFWIVSTNDKDKKTVEFDYVGALDFLEANSFHKIHTIDLKPGEYKLVKIDDNIVSECSGTQIRDFVYHYVQQSTKDKDVLNMFVSRLGNLLGIDKLERLTEIDDDFTHSEPMAQSYFYKGSKIYVTEAGITQADITENVWAENLIRRRFHRQPIVKFIKRFDDGGFDLDFTEAGKRCEFLQFLLHTSNFWKGRESFMSPEDYALFYQHIINKLTAIGYLLNSWKPRTEQICIVAMDAKMDEVGASNGRSGKSMIGLALSKVLNVQTVDMKKSKNDDEFIYSLVTPKTRVIFLDDTRVNFDFENFYSALTGDLQINPKQGGRFEIKYDRAPKFYITTNHSLNDQSDSGKDRRVMVAFSPYFSTSYTPADAFGHQLFDDWDDEQWNLFDNLMMECIMYYLRSITEGWAGRKGRGVVPPPMEQLERRSMRQTMGEAFLQWADAFFDPSNTYLNYKVSRKELSDKYHEEYPSAKESIRAADFRKRMIAFCRYKGYHFNPSQPNADGVRFSDWRATHQGETFIGEAYKSNSKEFWTIATDEFSKVQPW